ncbi:MAG TPA: molybdenum ABC transporter ATP-binding protein [Burkholderiales bacterium]|nr:molybdenum ABC transporter ATP-binding protein [Burkholderiales bacterium]
MTLTVDIEHKLGAFQLKTAFEAGEGVTALFGRSGAGKTSVVNAIAGILHPDRGRIVINGEPVFDSEHGIDVPTPRRRIGYVFQEGRLFPHLNVQQNLRYAGLFSRGTPPSEFAHVVELLGLKDLLDRRPGNLSGGEKQRVAIGRALLSRPRLLLLDEPLASLDAHRKSEVLQYIELMRDEIKIPIVYVSHAVEEVVRLADTVVLITAGEVAAVGAAEDVMGHSDLRTAAFEGGAVIDAKVVEQDMQHDLATLAFDGGTLVVTNVDALIGEPVRVRIRARDVSIALKRPEAISIQNILAGTLREVSAERSGAVDVSVAIGAVTLRSRITVRSAQQLGLAPGLEVYALIKAVSLDRRSGMG